MICDQRITELEDEIAERLRLERRAADEIERLRADKAELLAALKLVLPEIERLEFCEATSDDGFGPRLRALRGILNSVRVAIVKAGASDTRGRERLSGPPCHPSGYWIAGEKNGPDTWEAVCNICGAASAAPRNDNDAALKTAKRTEP